eukprot:5616308-Pyramimonas_sp.AAC.1
MTRPVSRIDGAVFMYIAGRVRPLWAPYVRQATRARRAGTAAPQVRARRAPAAGQTLRGRQTTGARQTTTMTWQQFCG